MWMALSAGLIFIARVRLLRRPGNRCQDCVNAAKIVSVLVEAAAVFDCTREGVLVTDCDGLIVHVDPCVHGNHRLSR